MSRPQAARRIREIFFAPAVLGVVSLAGLIFALLVDGPAEALAWISVGTPIAAIVWAWTRRRTWPAARPTRHNPS
jgi:hypothetical protein